MTGADHLRVSALGSFAAVTSDEAAEWRDALHALLSLDALPTRAEAHRLLGDAFPAMLDAALIEPAGQAERVPDEALETFLPRVLPALSDQGRAVLSEARNGLFLDAAGLSRDDAEELAATGARLHALLERGGPLSDSRLGLYGGALGLVDPAGHAELGFWPMHIGRYVFLMTVFGLPDFDSDAFRRLVWVMHQRYGGRAGESSG